MVPLDLRAILAQTVVMAPPVYKDLRAILAQTVVMAPLALTAQ